MKQICKIGSIIALCICLLVGCGGRSQSSGSINDTEDGNMSQIQNQEMITEVLYQYFQQAFDAKGNALDTPEQIALELAEVKALTVNMTLPEDYEAQYKEWRTEYIEALLNILQEEYDQIMSEVPLYDGKNAGAAFAEFVDFESDGIKELFILNLSWESPLYEWTCSMEVYGEDSGHVTQYGKISLPSIYYCGADPKSITFAQNNGHTYIHAHDEQGQDIFDHYYKVTDGAVIIADETSCIRMYDEWQYTSLQAEVTPEVYNTVSEKYTDEVWLLGNVSSVMPVKTRGLLPELSSEAKQKSVYLDVLNNNIIKYANLLDFNRDGNEDLVVIEKSTDRYIYCIYLWNGTEVERIPFEDMHFGLNLEGGIYRKKSTGELYLHCNDDVDGLYDVNYQFANLTDSDTISTEDYEQIRDEYAEGWYFSDEAAKAFYERLNRYEAIDEFCLWYDTYNDRLYTISDTIQKILNQ